MRKNTPEEAAVAKVRWDAYVKDYNSKPENRAKAVARAALPDAKAAKAAYMAAYNARPEVKAAKDAYVATRTLTPEAKAAKAARRATRNAIPEVQAANTAYATAYNARPEVKEAKAAHHAARRVRPEFKMAKAARDAARYALPDVKAASAACAAARRSTPLGSLINRVRCRTAGAFRARGIKKGSKTEEILGCEWAILKSHIEAQFTEGMTWENRNEWHVDHRIPLASAKDRITLVKLCHYTNLQPLWWRDNLAKGAKLHFTS